MTDSPKEKMLRVRIDSKTEQELNIVCERRNKSKSEVVRAGIEHQYEEICEEENEH